MARKPGSSPSAIKNRAAKTAAARSRPPVRPSRSRQGSAPREEDVQSASVSREVRAEARKITWTTRKETWITSVMVFIMVVLASLFFTWSPTGCLGLGCQPAPQVRRGG